MTSIEKKYRALELLMKVDKDTVIEQITNILLNNVSSDETDFEITEDLKNELNLRREKYLKGEGKSYSWDEVKAKARASI